MHMVNFDLYIYWDGKKQEPREILQPPMGNEMYLPMFHLINTLVSAWPEGECSQSEEYMALNKVTTLLDLKAGVPAPPSSEAKGAFVSDLMFHQHLRKEHFETPVYGYSPSTNCLDEKLPDNDFTQQFMRKLLETDDYDNDELKLDCDIPVIEDDNPFAPDAISYTQELMALVIAAERWINVVYKDKPIERYIHSSLDYFGENPTHSRALEFTRMGRQDIGHWLMFDILNRRYRSISSRLYLGHFKETIKRSKRDPYNENEVTRYIFEYPVFSEIYTASGILPLAWMELIFAVKNNIYASVCKNCDRLFPIPDKRQNNKDTCSDACAKEFPNKSKELIEKDHKYSARKTMKSRYIKDGKSVKKIQEDINRLVEERSELRKQLKGELTFLGIPW